METQTDLYLFLISTAFISLTGVMMPGPVFAVTVTKGYRNKIAGALIAFGHGVIEFPLMALIYVGFGQFFSSSSTKLAIGIVGGIMLMYVGIEMFRARGKTQEEVGGNLKYGSFTAGIITTGANPYFFLWWATIGAALIMSASIFGIMGFLLFAITHWLCDFLWDLFVSLTVFKSRSLWSKRVHEIVFGLCAVVLVGFGTWFIVSVLM
mgnify:CR=1 FL=1